MNALSLYGSADLSRRFSGDLDALLDGGRKRRAKRRPKKHNKAEALFAALGLDGAKRRKKAKRTAKRRTPPRDPRTGLFLKRGAKKRTAHRSVSNMALFAALGLDAARKPRRRKARKASGVSKRALFHALFGAAAKKTAKKPARKRAPRKTRLTPEQIKGMDPEVLKIYAILGKLPKGQTQKQLSEEEKFRKACIESPAVKQLCDEGWKQSRRKTVAKQITELFGEF